MTQDQSDRPREDGWPEQEIDILRFELIISETRTFGEYSLTWHDMDMFQRILDHASSPKETK